MQRIGVGKHVTETNKVILKGIDLGYTIPVKWWILAANVVRFREVNEGKPLAAPHRDMPKYYSNLIDATFDGKQLEYYKWIGTEEGDRKPPDEWEGWAKHHELNGPELSVWAAGDTFTVRCARVAYSKAYAELCICKSNLIRAQDTEEKKKVERKTLAILENALGIPVDIEE